MKKIEKKQKNSSSSINNSKKMDRADQTIIGIDDETEIDFVIMSDGKTFHVNIQKETDQVIFGKMSKKSFINWLAH